MRLIVDLGQMLPVEMGVDLRGANAGVAKHFLHCAQVTRGLQHMTSKGMAQHVRMYVLIQAYAPGPAREAKFYAALPEPFAGLADKEREFVGRCGAEC